MCHTRALLGFTLATAAYGLSLAVTLADYECAWLDGAALVLSAAAGLLLTI